jgi:hypothetical protein
MSEKELKTKYCDHCGGFMKYETGMQLLSSPPQYKGKCKDCGEIKFTYCDDVINYVGLDND